MTKSENFGAGFWNVAPLRKIVREEARVVDARFPTAVIPWEVLECGHELHQKQDIYGHTNAVRRRCWMCLTEHNEAVRSRRSTIRELAAQGPGGEKG